MSNSDPQIRKEYMAFAMSKRHRDKKKKSVDYKGGKCCKCGYDKSLSSLVFHHRDPTQKDFSISGKNWEWERIKNELDKCDLLCANCHGEEHERLAIANFRARQQKIRAIIPEKQILGTSVLTCNTCKKKFERQTSQIRRKHNYCSHKCSPQKQTKIKWPKKEKLEVLVKEFSMLQLSKKLGVSDNAIRKRCKKLSINYSGVV